MADRADELGRRSCEDVILLVSAEVDGAASEDERLVIARHTARCGACAEARADYLALGAQLAEADPLAGAAPSPAVWDAIERHLKISTEPVVTAQEVAVSRPNILESGPARAERSWARAARAAAVAATVSAAFFAGRVTAPETPPAPAPAGVEVATAQVSAEAEKQALRALADVLSMMSADRRGGGFDEARPASTTGHETAPSKGPEGKKSY